MLRTILGDCGDPFLKIGQGSRCIISEELIKDNEHQSSRQFSIEREKPIVKPESARALWIFAMILAVVGSVIPSPSGRFFVSMVAALIALPPAIFGPGRSRFGGAIACILALVLAIASFPAMQKDQAAYVESTKRKKTATSVPAPGLPGEVAPGSK